MIIGINGPIGSGKNEVAKILEETYGFKAMGFADKLKQSAAVLFGINPEKWEEIKNDPESRVTLKWGRTLDVGGEWWNEVSVSGREFLKKYGTESHRDILGYNIWVDALLGNLTAQDNVAIYDARFDNELRAIKQYRGVTIQVRRPGHEFDPSHPSETPPDPDLIDYTIHNNQGLDELKYSVMALVESEKLATPSQLDAKDNPALSLLQQPVLSS